MKRLRRNIFNGLTVLSLVLCILTPTWVSVRFTEISGNYQLRIGHWSIATGVEYIQLPTALTLLFAVLPVLWFVMWTNPTKSTAAGICPICGYDLRATPERCPECGTAMRLAN